MPTFTLVVQNHTDIPGEIRLRGYAGNITIEHVIVRGSANEYLFEDDSMLYVAVIGALVMVILIREFKRTRRVVVRETL